MPELPEIETIKRDLEKKIINKEIVDFKVINPGRMIRDGFQFVKKQLKERKIKEIKRRGKLLIFILDNQKVLLVHLKMTGQLIYQKGKILIPGGHDIAKGSLEKELGGIDLPNKYTRVIFIFKNGAQLFFNDLRKFGYLKIVDKKELKKIKENFGIEPGTKEFTLSNLKKVLTNKKTKIKIILLDQKNIAGIGNIYADEILYEAKIKPMRIAQNLRKAEVENLFKAIQKIIKKAIKWRGTTFNTYVDGSGRKGNFTKFLKVYRKEGEKCSVCKNKIKKIKLGGRGTHFCPKCQK